MSDDLWAEASADFARERREASLALADAHLEAVMPFLLAARSPQEYAHRSFLAQASIASIAARCELDPGDLMETARRRYDLYREALMEGQDPVEEVAGLAQGGSGFGSGPEKPGSHEDGPGLSGAYSEVPAGPPGGPPPQVTRPRPPAMGPVTEATGARRTAGPDPEQAMMPGYVPPDTGLGNGSLDTGVASAATGGMPPSVPAGPRMAAAQDPVRQRVASVTAMVARSNPGLPTGECERIARQVVGRYLRHGAAPDLSSSVMSDAPVSSGDGDHGGGDHGGGAMEHMLEGQGLRSLLPGMGGGAAGGAAGGAGMIEEAAPLLALAARR